MSTDTERVTLTDEECVAIVGASIAPDRVLSGRDGHDGSPPDVLLMTVERIVAARERALREEIAGEIEAHGAWWDHSPDWRGGVDEAGDIARGIVR